LIEFPTN